MTPAGSAEEAIKDIRRAARRHWSAEDKIRIVLEGLRGEESISELRARSASRSGGAAGEAARPIWLKLQQGGASRSTRRDATSGVP
jgi:transposase-like protein